MKILITIALLILTNPLSSDELDWVDKQIEAIKPPRTGLQNSTINTVKDPFIFLKKNRTEKPKNKKIASKRLNTNSKNIKKTIVKKRVTLTLDAIMNNSALISGKWYKVGESLNGYKLKTINPTSVLLTKSGKKLLLSTRSINKNLNFKNK